MGVRLSVEGNLRVQGRVAELLAEREFGEAPREGGRLARAASEAEIRAGFEPFRFERVVIHGDKRTIGLGGTAYALWLDSPQAFAGDRPENQAIAERLGMVWRNSLGAMLVAIPEQDAYAIVWHHSAGRITHGYSSETSDNNGWSSYGPGAMHALGGFMAYSSIATDEADLAAFLQGAGVLKEGQRIEDAEQESFSPEQKANLLFLSAAIMVAEKAYAMCTKWTWIDKRIRELCGRLGLQMDTTDLGGAKTIGLHRLVPDGNDPLRGDVTYMGGKKWSFDGGATFVDESEWLGGMDETTRVGMASKLALARAVGYAARKTGLYVSGGDQNMPLSMTEVVAEIGWRHMAGAPQFAHWSIAGRAPSDYTGAGVARGIGVFLDDILKDPQGPIVLVGYGGVSKGLVKRLVQEGQPRNIAAVVESSVMALLKAQKALGPFSPTVYVFDVTAARGFTKDEAEIQAMIAQARRCGFQVSQRGLEGAIDLAMQVGVHKYIAVLSANGSSHPITTEVVEALARHKKDGDTQAVQAVLGGANNMHAITGGSFMPVARHAVANRVFIPYDSGYNGMGATIVMANATRIDDANAEHLIQATGKELYAQYKQAFLEGVPPQQWGEDQSKLIYNARVLAGDAFGGYFDDVAQTSWAELQASRSALAMADSGGDLALGDGGGAQDLGRALGDGVVAVAAAEEGPALGGAGGTTCEISLDDPFAEGLAGNPLTMGVMGFGARWA